jgi:hypothetical protein
VRLLFRDDEIRRLYETGAGIAGMDELAIGRFFEVAAVLKAARALKDVAALRAFVPSRVGGRWSVAVPPGWCLLFSVEEASPVTACLEELRRLSHRRRTP